MQVGLNHYSIGLANSSSVLIAAAKAVVARESVMLHLSQQVLLV